MIVALSDASTGGLVAVVLGIIAAIAQVAGSYVTASQKAATEADTLKAELDGQLWERIHAELESQNERIADLERRLAETAVVHSLEVRRLTDERDVAEKAHHDALRRLSEAQAEIDNLKDRVNVLEERQTERRHENRGRSPDRRQT